MDITVVTYMYIQYIDGVQLRHVSNEREGIHISHGLVNIGGCGGIMDKTITGTYYITKTLLFLSDMITFIQAMHSGGSL
jgi:hypothetical protein